jgi:hypothetical protein
MQTPTKRKSAKKESAIFDEPTTPKTPKSFQKRLEAIGSDKRTRTRNDTILSDSIAVTPPKIKKQIKSSVKHPTQNELERIKAQVLGKLCGRIPIPLVGKPAETAE